MRKVFPLVLLLLFYGCSSILYAPDEAKIRKYSRVEIWLSDFSYKITAYYENQGLPIPANFNGSKFIEILEKIYPDQTKVRSIKNEFKIKARSIDNGYSVILCAPDTDNKIMEDFSCNLKSVEIRYWDKEGAYPCSFEQNWKAYCK